MRLLVILQAEEPSDQIGFHDACVRLNNEGVISEYHWLCRNSFVKSRDWINKWDELIDRAKDSDPEIVILQYFHDPQICDVQYLFRGLRSVVPQATICVSSGDGYTPGRLTGRPFPQTFITAACLSDITFLTMMGRTAKELVQRGVKNLVLCPNGYCQSRFAAEFNMCDYSPEFDIGFIGSYHTGRNPFAVLNRANAKRRECVEKLSKRYGKRFAVFGNGWQNVLKASWHGPVAYRDQVTTMRKSRILVGGYPGCMEDYYTSDRAFIAASSAIPTIDFIVPRVDRLLRDGEDWYLVHGINKLIIACDRLLASNQDELMEKSIASSKRASMKHTQYSRVKFMIETARNYYLARKSGQKPPAPIYDFFLPEVKIDEELPFALMNWS